MKNKKLFSIIIPHCNQVYSCIDTVKSLLKHSLFSDCEIIIIDNATRSNNFFYLLNSLQSLNSKQIHLIRSSLQLFPGGARNLGALKSNGKYLVFIDSDCTLESIPCNSDVKKMIDQLELDIIIFGKTILNCKNKRFNDFFNNYFSHLWNQKNAANFLLISKKYFFKTMGFMETIKGGEDLFFFAEKNTAICDKFQITHNKELDFTNFLQLQFNYGSYSGSFFSRNEKTFSGKISKDHPVFSIFRFLRNLFFPFKPTVIFYKLIYYIGFAKGMMFK
ncbi:glycosyltransferase family 2 protein [bacterium]|nr:glycosyltransferase family 2 protein [bacterium]